MWITHGLTRVETDKISAGRFHQQVIVYSCWQDIPAYRLCILCRREGNPGTGIVETESITNQPNETLLSHSTSNR
jgi:hypothetical protein